jgi:hypothetical protein
MSEDPEYELDPVHIEEGCHRCGCKEFTDDQVVVYCNDCGLVRGHENQVDGGCIGKYGENRRRCERNCGLYKPKSRCYNLKWPESVNEDDDSYCGMCGC